MSSGGAGHHVARGKVEHQARSEAVGQLQVELGAEVIALTFRPAVLAGLPAGEVRLETAAGHEEGVGVHLIPRPVRRNVGPNGEGRRPRVAGLEPGHDAAVLVPADLRGWVAARARGAGADDLVVL